MNTLRSGEATWLVRAPVEPRISLRRARAQALARAAALAGLVCGAALGLLPAPAPAEGSRTMAPRIAAAAKDTSRLAAVAAPYPPPIPGLAGGPDPAVTGALTPGSSGPAAASAPSEWREAELSQVEVLDGRTLATPTLRIRLAGLELPKADEACRTLDGRLEACVARAATQLELITRSRKLACRYRLESAEEGVGTCRIGASDLAERLVRTGYAKRSGG